MTLKPLYTLFNNHHTFMMELALKKSWRSQRCNQKP